LQNIFFSLAGLADGLGRICWSQGVNFINISRAFFCTKIWRQKFYSQNVTREKLYKALFYIKDAHKTLMKLTL
jgi:hypothetical protein